MADGHNIADITQDDTGNLQLIVFNICGAGKSKDTGAVDDADDNAGGISDTTSDHKLLAFIENQNTHYRKDVSKGNRRSCGTDQKGIENTIADKQIKTIPVCSLSVNF